MKIEVTQETVCEALRGSWNYAMGQDGPDAVHQWAMVAREIDGIQHMLNYGAEDTPEADELDDDLFLLWRIAKEHLMGA